MAVTPGKATKEALKTATQAPAAAKGLAPGVAGEAYSLGEVKHGVGQPPSVPRSPPFLLAYKPERWTVIEGRVVPALATIVLAPGLERVQGVGGQDPTAWRDAVSAWTERGWTVIPWSDGPGGASYMKRVPVAGGHARVTVWEQLYAGSDRIGTDSAGYCDWMDGLIAGGKLPPPAAHGLQALRERVKSELDTVADQAVRTPSKAELAKRLTADLAAVEAKLNEVLQAAGPVGGETDVLEETE